MDSLELILGKISDIVWGYPLPILLMGTHIYLTFKLKFIQHSRRH
jgi:alanine or glycine:cation symporter, AGCS family